MPPTSPPDAGRAGWGGLVPPAGYRLRRASTADIPAVTAMVNAAERVDLGEILLEVEDLETDWAGPSIDLEADVLLVETDTEQPELAGWAQIEVRSAQADVHPAHRGRGIGALLADFLERRAVDTSRAAGLSYRVGQAVAEQPEGGMALLRARGWEPGYTSWVLRLPESAPLPRVDLGPDLAIRPHRDEAEEHAAYEVIEAAFSRWPNRDARTFEEWRAAATRHAAFRPGLLHVAVHEPDQRVVGACLGLRYPGDGWVQQVAVDAAERGRGIGGALLASVFGAFRQMGEPNLGLSTDSRTGALDLYLHLGMEVTMTLVHLDLTHPPDAGPR